MNDRIPALCGLTVVELVRLLDRGEVSSTEITRAYLNCIRERDLQIHAFLEVFEEEALAGAAMADQRRAEKRTLSALDGIPVAIKDNMVMKGHLCSCASKMLADFRSPYTSTVVAKLQAAGMPILGRLNMDEFAMGSSTENSAMGVTRNPWNLEYVPGGSSGGSAAAVAAGMTPVALGSDTGGSIRQPASFCGVVGVKPAYGTVSRYGLVAFASSLDQIGPLCKTAADAALVMNVIAGYDAHDATSDGALQANFTTDIKKGSAPLFGLCFGLPKECFGQGLQEEVKDALLHAAQRLKALGAEVKEVSVPSLPYALSAYYVISSAEASSNLARFDGVRYGYRAKEYADLDELYRKSRQEAFGMEVKRRVMLGTFALSSGYQDQYYLKAQQVRELLRYDVAQALTDCAALLSPVAPTPAYRLGEKTADPMEMYLGDIYTVPANITGLPAVSLPCGLSSSGLPIGMSLMGARDSLPTLMGAAACYEQSEKVNAGLHPYDFTEGSERK
ncbi:MAG: Asp-tRNA(Asn)/Glu-tRNA(Gln) amidotransferase subunit GatA [Eubacteriales bacterium]|nr:Asp-tRNA(Asn)/Glu-tRNA(Gln) amidotransferase subunit GatA [Eubacteriales bacterium]